VADRTNRSVADQPIRLGSSNLNVYRDGLSSIRSSSSRSASQDPAPMSQVTGRFYLHPTLHQIVPFGGWPNGVKLQAQHRRRHSNPYCVRRIPSETCTDIGGAGDEHSCAGIVDTQFVHHQISHGVDGHLGSNLQSIPFAGGHPPIRSLLSDGSRTSFLRWRPGRLHRRRTPPQKQLPRRRPWQRGNLRWSVNHHPGTPEGRLSHPL
jgi:hypothetical protein